MPAAGRDGAASVRQEKIQTKKPILNSRCDFAVCIYSLAGRWRRRDATNLSGLLNDL